MPFAVFLAYRFLVDGRAQTLLIVIGVAVGVAVQVFVTALIDGLQRDLVDRTVGVQAHAVVEPLEERARRLRDDESVAVLASVERPAQRVRSIDGWPRMKRIASEVEGVRDVAPRVSGPALAVHGAASASVVVSGVVAEAYDRIVPTRRHLVRGALRLDGSDAVLGVDLAEDLGVTVGDRVRVDTGGGRGALFTVRGIFDLGSKEANARRLLVSLRAGQTLFGLAGGATQLDIAVSDVFDAERVAARLRDRTGLPVESWMQTNAQLLSALRSQRSSSSMISFFVLVAVAMGITSVLVVSVVQRSGQIGILRAVGATRGTVLAVFLLQGGAMGLVGALAGSAMGSGLALLFRRVMAATQGIEHSIDLTPTLFVTTALVAVVTGLLAAALPARHASRLDPVVAIRHG